MFWEAGCQPCSPTAYLIHMTHEVDDDEGNAFLPESVRLAYDGQVLEV